IRGEVRIAGSRYDARDYISQQRGDEKDGGKEKDPAAGTVNPREKLQKELMQKVKKPCEDLGVRIMEIVVAQPDMSGPQNAELLKLAEQISEREKTRVEREKNKELVNQYKTEQEEKAKGALSEQRKKVVEANTKLEREKINAERLKEV